jgi:thioesterase domain-containing protein
VGHSFGGLVTYEIARQLAAKNEPVGLLGLLDTYQRSITEEDAIQHVLTPQVHARLPIFKRVVKDLKELILGQYRFEYLQERKTYIQAWIVKTTYRCAYRITTRFGWGMPKLLNDVKEANWIAADYFTPGTYDGKAVFFRCQNRLPTDPPDSTRIWQRLVKGGVEILEVPGDHNSMLKEPGVAVLAQQILGILRQQNATTKETVTTS